MNLADLKSKGGLVESAPVKKTIEWKHVGEDGTQLLDVFDIHVLQLGYGVMERAMRRDPGNPDRSLTAALIAEAVLLGDNADERLTYEDALLLNPSLARVLSDAIQGANAPKKSKPPMSSGTN